VGGARYHDRSGLRTAPSAWVPVGRHRYFHKLYALDTVLEGLNIPAKAQLEFAMQGHIVAQAELLGT